MERSCMRKNWIKFIGECLFSLLLPLAYEFWKGGEK